MADDRIGRRALMGGAVGMAGLAALPALAQDGTTEFQAPVSGSVRNNVSSFRMPQWRDYFENTKGGAILADTKSRALHYWSEDQSIYRLYPSSVPLSEELTRLGRTEIVRKAVNPPWRPTASMLERNPDWPKMVEGGAKVVGFDINQKRVDMMRRGEDPSNELEAKDFEGCDIHFTADLTDLKSVEFFIVAVPTPEACALLKQADLRTTNAILHLTC